MAADPGTLPYQSLLYMLLALDVHRRPTSSIDMDNVKNKYGEEGNMSPQVFNDLPTLFSSHGTSGTGSSSSWGSNGLDKGGYEYDFITKVDEKYECPICCYTLRNANQTCCGHRFCGSCIRRWIRDQRPPATHGTCPVCLEKLSEKELFEDNFAKREILSLKIYCPNRSKGCTTVIELRNIEEHLSVCIYVLVECPIGCGKSMLRKDVEEHKKSSCERRKIKCSVCGEEVPIDKKDSHLAEDCPMVEVACCNCSAKLKRIAIDAHKEKDCPKVLVNCVFKSFGCSTRMEREQLETHLEIGTQLHLKMVADAVDKLKQNQPVVSEIIASFLSKAGGTGGELPKLPGSGTEQPFRHAVNSRTPGSPNSHPSTANPFETVLRSRDAHYGDVPHHRHTHPPVDSLSLHLPTGYSDPLPSRSGYQHPTDMYTSHQVLRRQSSLGGERSGGQSTSQELRKLIETQHDMERKLLEQQLHISALNSKEASLEQQLKDQQATIQKQSETIQSMEARNCGGKYVWKIDNYSQKKYDAQCGQRTVIHSPSFHTSMFGYKLCVRLNLNGVDSATGTHLSLFVHFMQGDYDDILDWPFSGKIGLAILDQNEGSSNKRNITETLISKPTLAAFQRPRSHRNHKGFGYVEFCPLSIIEGGSQYLKNDTLFIKVTVDMD